MTKEKGLPLTSTHWGTYRAKVKNGKVEELLGWEHDKDPSPIGIVLIAIKIDRISLAWTKKQRVALGLAKN